MLRRHPGVSSAFTLVELLVVIAIIGILVALLLPAVQAAREAARRTQCSNQMRQMGLAMQNHVDSIGTFPTGGIDPWPRIEDYAQNGKPFSAPKQGLSWAFQILPYLEEEAVHNIAETPQLAATPVNMYFCPSRRGPTLSTLNRWLMDYAAMVGTPTRGQIGEPEMQYGGIRSESQFDAFLQNGDACATPWLWGSTGDPFLSSEGEATYNRSGPSSNRFPTFGVIVRSSYYVVDGTGANGSPVVVDLKLPKATTFSKIADGSSKTIVLCEKRIKFDRFGGPHTDDDAGWSDGWDFDTLRLGSCQPEPDSSDANGIMIAGSSHPSVFFCAFADGSVQGIPYDINLETLMQLANKADGEVVNLDSL